jgi:hypothetical protein
MRWRYRDPGLLWLFLPAYMIHVAEEWFAGFPVWLQQIVGRPVPSRAFVLINAAALVLLIASIRAATRTEQNGWIGIAIATILLINTAAHAVGAALTRSYAPGLVSAVVFYVPLGALVMIRAFDQAPRAQVERGIIAGIVVHSLVFVVAFLSARM